MSYDQWLILLMIAVALFAVMATYSVVGLVAIWGARGRGHWFLRMAAVLAFLGAWLFTVDSRLYLLFLCQTAVVVIRLSFVKRRPQQSRSDADALPVHEQCAQIGRRFSLAELLLVMVLLSGALAMLVRLPPQVRWSWRQDVLPGGMLGVFTLVAVWAAESKSSRWLRAATLVIAFPSLLMGGWLWLARSARGSVGRAAAGLSLLLIALLPARIYYEEFGVHSLAYPPRIAENGYVDLLRAAELVDDPAVNVDKLSGDELRAYLQKQEPALDLAEQALKRPCQAVLDERMDDILLSAEGKQLEKLSQTFAARGRLELQEERVESAVKSYLTVIELGAAITHGGVLMHDGFGFMAERLGVEGLQKLVPRLDDDACRKLAARLQEIDARREPAKNSAARERLYQARAYPWKHRVKAVGRALFPSEEVAYDDVIFPAVFGEKCARLRLLVSHLALRRYWLAAQSYPNSLEKLVPNYLPGAPLDPFSDRALTYKKLPAGYLLYSIGNDRTDDSGSPSAPLAWPVPNGDIVVAVDLPMGDGESSSETKIGE
jgi:hypothetical protein